MFMNKSLVSPRKPKSHARASKPLSIAIINESTTIGGFQKEIAERVLQGKGEVHYITNGHDFISNMEIHSRRRIDFLITNLSGNTLVVDDRNELLDYTNKSRRINALVICDGNLIAATKILNPFPNAEKKVAFSCVPNLKLLAEKLAEAFQQALAPIKG